MRRGPLQLLLPCSIPVLAAGMVLGVGPDDAWLSQTRQRIARAEYQITWQTQTALGDLAASWHAPNRAHGFRTYFTDTGIRVVPRTEEVPSWEWSLTLTGCGRPGAVRDVSPAIVGTEGNRVEYVRSRLVEWYVNDARGVEQGFTLAAPPAAGSAAANEVWIELALGGTLRPLVSANGQAIDFATHDGTRVIHYSHLEVTDAMGRVLPARMVALPGHVRLLFEDATAVYPVTVDPLATTAAWTAEGDQAAAFLGFSVGTAGDVNGDGYSDVIVGAIGYDNGETDEGRAYVYLGSAAGLGAVEAWTAEGNQVGARFGTVVATAGDVDGDGYSDVIVGAPSYTNGEHRGSGLPVPRQRTRRTELAAAAAAAATTPPRSISSDCRTAPTVSGWPCSDVRPSGAAASSSSGRSNRWALPSTVTELRSALPGSTPEQLGRR